MHNFFFSKNPVDKRPLGGYIHMQVDTIKMDLKDVRWEGVNWIHLAQDRVQSQDVLTTIMNVVFL